MLESARRWVSEGIVREGAKDALRTCTVVSLRSVLIVRPRSGGKAY